MKRTIPFLLSYLFLATLLSGQTTGHTSFDLHSVPGFLQMPEDGNVIQPTGVAVNSAGHIFVFNKGNKQLMEFGEDGSYVRSIGAGIFKDPHGLRIDRYDNIWVTDLVSHMVIKLNPQGQVEMVLGQNGTQGLYEEGRDMVLFFKPADITFAPNGDLYVADGYGNHRIVQLNKHGRFIRTWGKQGPEAGNFDNPHNIIYYKNRLYVADRYNSRIQVFDLEGKHQASWTNVGKPWGLAVSPEGNIYMTEGDAEQILKLDPDGNILGTYIAGPGAAPGQLRAAHGIAVGLNEELYVTEVLNWRVQRYDQKWQRGPWHRIDATGCAHYRHESAFAEVNGKFYALGGRNTHTVDIFDPETKSWSQGTVTPLEMHHFQSIVLDDEIWVVGAFTGPYPKEEPIAFLHVYNPSSDSWRIAGRLPDGRHRGAAGAIVYEGKIYLLCGNELGHYTGHTTWFDVFDPKTGEWTTLPDAPHTRDHFQMAVIDGKLYAAGGRNSSAKTNRVMEQTIAEVDVFDFATNTWTTLPSDLNLPTLRAGTTVVTLDDQLVVMGGESGSQVSAHEEVEAFDVKKNRWNTLHPMLEGRHGMQAIKYNNRVYIAGGSSNRGGGPETKTIDCWELKR
ncbi:MAG: hypothetical protein HKN87_04255 [Saprospiraceae bacterium]|nr:hypothetical protein [Saprospiraceae bacterium]